MKTNKIIITSLFLSIGLILHQITPGIFLGIKPDFLLVFMILSIILTKDFKITFITGIVAGVLCALTTTFPGGQFPNIIDKIITSMIVYGIYKNFNSNSPLKLTCYLFSWNYNKWKHFSRFSSYSIWFTSTLFNTLCIHSASYFSD